MPSLCHFLRKAAFNQVCDSLSIDAAAVLFISGPARSLSSCNALLLSQAR
ncbi:hypothetical protein P5P93_24525 [Klebsiella pneumoniae]|nr:hypothetical protein P5P93_24525 [Klebsiella pneumoniae]